MEIVQKLVAMALVSTVSSPDGLQQALGITLGMAAMVALVQPYLKPQADGRNEELHALFAPRVRLSVYFEDTRKLSWLGLSLRLSCRLKQGCCSGQASPPFRV